MSYYSQQNDEHEPSGDRELTLSTTTIVGIFFGLVLLCAATFGLGYNLGAKSHASAPPVVEASSNAAPVTTPLVTSSAAKPSAASPVLSAPSATHPVSAPTDADSGTAASTARPTQRTPVRPADPDAMLVGDAMPTPHHAPTALHPSPGTANVAAPTGGSTTATGSFIVQVAAVSHAEDAELLVSALKAKGYAVVSRTSPADKFFHIQIGPFPTKPAAEATRQRLIADGYNAIVK